MSFNKSSLQTMAIQLILDTITSNLKSFQSIDNVLSSLCILGGYIQPLCLGSIVEIHDNDGIQLGVIIDINKNVLDLNTTDVLPYLVQFIQTNEIKWIREDKLRIQKDVLPPNLLELTDTNEFIDLLFDALAYFIQIDKSTIDSLLLLQLKRRSILVLYRILNHKKLVDIFIQKPYVSIIAQLSISALLLKTYQQSTNLHLLNKHQLEQYCLNLDRCKYFKQIINNNMNNTLNDEFIIWTKIPFKTDLLIDDLLSTNEWKSSMSKRNIELFKKGRLGNDEIKIIELSSQLTGKWFLEECGITHRFPGRIYLVSENSNKLTATFIIENLQLTEGNWYFCIRLLESTSIRIGWATNGFKSNDSIGIGYDQYSWSYDGSQGMIYNNEQYPFEFENIRWNTNDVCGCGIEINDNHIRINYWLNGYFLGTAFTHQLPINSTTTTICNMLPNGNRTSYFPGVSLNVNETSILSSCEFIFHPMDMFECPLPNGYKPLVIPTLLDINDLFVPYPFSAYLIGNNIEDYIIHKRNNRSIKFLRDFINNYHLENIFILDNHQLILTEQSEGFPLTIDYEESLTISFNFSILKISNDYLDIILLTFDTQDKYSIRIPINKITNNTQIAIIFQINERKIKVYINNECRIFECPIITKFNIYILPTLNIGIQNLAIWKYSLTEEHIQRLFTSGLSYIAIDYYRLNQYRKQVNMFTFTMNQQYFENDLLIPFNELFDEIKWKKKKIEIDEDESKYFNINNGNIQLFGNKTYLVLDKSIDPWFEYTLIFDISITYLPITLVRLNEHSNIYKSIDPWFEYTLIFDISITYLPITLVRLNEHSNICIAHDGQLCLSINNEKIIQSQSKLPLNEYIRLLISVHDKSIKIYVNGLLKLDTNLNNNQLAITDKRIDLFKELDLTTNIINEDILRIECKSIIYLNKTINDIDEKMTSSNYSLESLIAFPYSIISPSLIHIGYDELSIKLAMKQTITRNIQLIDTILREKNFNKYNENILSKFGFSINKEKLKDLIEFFSQYDTEEKIINLGEILLNLENNIQTLSIDKNWFHQTIDNNLTEWIQDKSNINEQIDLTYQLIDLNQSIQEKSILTNNNQLNNIEYPHKDMTQLKYYESRISCEYQLISIYAHYTILNILKIWSYDGSCLFPLEKFGDYEPIDRMSLLINSIIKIELNELIKYYKIKHNNITYDILQSKAPLLYHLQKDIMIQSIKILIDPSLLILEYNDEYNIEKPNFKFILKLIQLFIKLISEKSIIKQEYIDLLMPVLFPESLINMLFNLFILNPLHENKCIILRLFSTLIQISHNFNLNKNIQNFLFHLFIELPPNSTSINTQTMRTFQIAIMDLIYLLIEKQKYQLISSIDITNELFKLPKSFHDLLMMIDIIKALTDKTKHTPFPEIFIIQSIIFLPNESIPNSLYYKSYPSLWHIPAIYIQIRAKIIYEFNIIFEKLISFIDLSLLPEQSILTNKIQQVKSYILYETKSKFFDTTVTITSLENINDIPTVNFQTVETNSNKSTMFNQAFEQLYNNAYITFRNECNQLWRAQYLAMHSTDQGGPYRDSITRICSDICSTRLSLFILCPNGRTNSGLNDDCWIPNIYPPNEFIPNRIKKQYQFIGQLMGMAIRKKHYLDLKFPNLLWKQLVREQITIEDIENIDIQCFTMINQMEKSIKENNSSIDMNEFLSNILDELRFEVLSSNGQTYELVPNGKNIPITISNFKDYCSSYREYHLNEFFRQIECIRQGLYSIVPGYFLGLFTASELEEMVCGKGEIDVELLKRNTMYGGHYNKDLLTIQRFWTILREMFNVEQKKLFLKFVWGRCTLPNCDDDFGTKFRIEPYILSNELIDGALPRAHTCTFVLDLPEYSTIDIMYDRLNYAITYCISIDGDGNMDEAPIPTDFESDSATEE
ncbi:unnamed protein product [Rotaria sordida]|uniref:HECT domain-containing protein n=1 Tax=Rotaria sordida TaxID=392033 RepID=A0A815CN04_9BILA|nr:unnamed protein product [Rotaria sordida]